LWYCKFRKRGEGSPYLVQSGNRLRSKAFFGKGRGTSEVGQRGGKKETVLSSLRGTGLIPLWKKKGEDSGFCGGRRGKERRTPSSSRNAVPVVEKKGKECSTVGGGGESAIKKGQPEFRECFKREKERGRAIWREKKKKGDSQARVSHLIFFGEGKKKGELVPSLEEKERKKKRLAFHRI